jgi:hypothetical protein
MRKRNQLISFPSQALPWPGSTGLISVTGHDRKHPGKLVAIRYLALIACAKLGKNKKNT